MPENIVVLGDELTEAARLKFIEAAKSDVPEEKAMEYENGTNAGNIATRKSAIEKLKKLIGNIIKSKDNEKAKLSGNSARKLVSETAVNKSIENGFTKSQHFAVASDIDSLFRNSIKVLTLPDKNNDPNVRAIHRFVTPLFGNNVAFITVKEATEQGKRIYSVELIEIGKLEGKVAEVKSYLKPRNKLP